MQNIITCIQFLIISFMSNLKITSAMFYVAVNEFLDTRPLTCRPLKYVPSYCDLAILYLLIFYDLPWAPYFCSSTCSLFLDQIQLPSTIF